MLFQWILILFELYSFVSTISLMKYENGQLISNTNSYLINTFTVQSRNECICRCFANENCKTLNYLGINQSCSLFSSQIQIENLQLVPYVFDSIVMILSNRTISTTTNVHGETTCINTAISTSYHVAFYSFDNNTLDSIGNYSMNANFTPNYVQGWIGLAVDFSYNNQQYLQSTHIPLDSRSFTIDFWFYAPEMMDNVSYSFAGERHASENYQCLFLDIRDRYLYIGFYSDDLIGTTSLSANQWYHATFVYDSTIKQQLIYLNGILDNGVTIENDFVGTSGPFTIGGANIDGSGPVYSYYSGYIDHFSISYRVKSPCEIYLNAILFCYFPFDSALGLLDSGPNYLNAINSNGISTIGRVNQGIEFSLLLSYIMINGVNILNTVNNSFTISMWIKPFNLTSGGTLLHTSTQSDGNCYALWGLTSSGSFVMNFIDSSNNINPIIISSLSIPINQWTHIVQVVNSSNENYLFLNGNLISSISSSISQAIGSYVFLGASPNNTSFCQSGSISMGQFYGIIDEFYVFAKALTSTDIFRLANP
ncbi:hypothetical protein I4U23_005036 [Adineta vaga]|nr:hypothetical protein I4U23_005036 [Adineta vaga]